MEIHKRNNNHYNNYSPGILNNNHYNKRNFLAKIPPNNINRIAPYYSGNPHIFKNRSIIYPPNYTSPINKNTSYNIYELNIPKKINNNNFINNQSNNYSSKYSTSSSSSLYLNNSKNFQSQLPSNYLFSKNNNPPLGCPLLKFQNHQNYHSPKPINKNLSSPYLNIKKLQNSLKRKTLILDLDETLVHSGFNPFSRKSDITLTINIDGRNHIVNVLKRSFVDKCLKDMAELFEIIVFIASIAEYASPLLAQLDKNHYFSRRLYR